MCPAFVGVWREHLARHRSICHFFLLSWGNLVRIFFLDNIYRLSFNLRCSYLKTRSPVNSYKHHTITLEATFMSQSCCNLLRVYILIKIRSSWNLVGMGPKRQKLYHLIFPKSDERFRAIMTPVCIVHIKYNKIGQASLEQSVSQAGGLSCGRTDIQTDTETDKKTRRTDRLTFKPTGRCMDGWADKSNMSTDCFCIMSNLFICTLLLMHLCVYV